MREPKQPGYYLMDVRCSNCKAVVTLYVPKGTTLQQYKMDNKETRKCFCCGCLLLPFAIEAD